MTVTVRYLYSFPFERKEARLEIARKLKDNGVSVEFIVQTTQLSAEEVEGL
jgi:hypothetical protein